MLQGVDSCKEQGIKMHQLFFIGSLLLCLMRLSVAAPGSVFHAPRLPAHALFEEENVVGKRNNNNFYYYT